MPDELTENQKIALAAYGKTTDSNLPAKTQEELDAEKKIADDALAAEAKKKEDEQKALLDAEKDKLPKAQLTDEELLAIASQRSGRQIKSWDELKEAPTEEEIKKKEENRDSEKLSYGLKKGLFNKNQYESFIADSKNPTSLIYNRELAEAKKEDPAWDEDKEKDFKDEFDERFGLTLDPTSAKFKRGQRELLTMADSLLKKEYGSIYQLDNEFSKHENEINSIQAQKQKVLTTAPIYKEDALKAVASVSSIEFTFGEEKYPIAVPAEAIKEVTDLLLDNEFTTNQILKGYSAEELKQVAHNYILAKNYADLAFLAAKQYRQKHEKGVRGIPEGGKLEKQEESTLTEKQQKAIDHFKGNPVTVAN